MGAGVSVLVTKKVTMTVLAKNRCNRLRQFMK